ncbi:MAG: hypothetical protein GY765_01135, partial [bacterium]|nr:hypothetical protein [bacterium]
VGIASSPVLRSTAQSGYLIGITCCTGESAAGLKLLQKGMHTGTMPRKHIHTTPYIKEGRILAPYANAMLDVSDGLLLDLKRILTASKKGAILRYNDIPVSDDLRRCCTEHHFNEQQLVLAGGEDYVLLFTLSPAKEAQLKETSLPYSIIGEITGSADQLDISRCDQPLSINSFGFDHFSVNK